MVYLPKEPIMLMSVLNTKLRDSYDSLQALCEDLDIDCAHVQHTLAQANFHYKPELNQFR